jgi:putative acetyltransferase
MEYNLKIRPVTAEDNATLARIIRSTLEEFGANHPGTVYFDESTDRLSTLFSLPRSGYFVIEENAVILGGAGIYPTRGLPVDTCELVKMYLLPQARKKGFGKAALLHCINVARAYNYTRIYLETMPELKQAISLYYKMGFERLDKPMGHTGHTGCNIWMILNLERYK